MTDMKYPYEIGRNLFEVITDKKISIEEAAEITELAFIDFIRVLGGQLYLSPRVWETIADKLDCSVERLLTSKGGN